MQLNGGHNGCEMQLNGGHNSCEMRDATWAKTQTWKVLTKEPREDLVLFPILSLDYSAEPELNDYLLSSILTILTGCSWYCSGSWKKIMISIHIQWRGQGRGSRRSHGLILLLIKRFSKNNATDAKKTWKWRRHLQWREFTLFAIFTWSSLLNLPNICDSQTTRNYVTDVKWHN